MAAMRILDYGESCRDSPRCVVSPVLGDCRGHDPGGVTRCRCRPELRCSDTEATQYRRVGAVSRTGGEKKELMQPAIVDAPEQHHHRHWSDIRKILESSSLPNQSAASVLPCSRHSQSPEKKCTGSLQKMCTAKLGPSARSSTSSRCAALESLDIGEIASGPVAVGLAPSQRRMGVTESSASGSEPLGTNSHCWC